MSLTSGWPDNYMKEEAVKTLRTAADHALKSDIDNQSFDGYGYGPAQGDPVFLKELAQFLTSEYGSPVESCNLLATGGASHGLHVVLSLMFSQHSVIFVEEPTYYYAIEIIQNLHYEVIPVPCDDDGIIPDELDHLVQRYYPSSFKPTNSRPYRAMTYLVPVFNNPCGHVYPTDRCKELISVARKHDLLLFCDDVYNLLYYYDAEFAPPRMFSMDDRSQTDYKGSVVSNSTFSKILVPSIRCGWLEGPSDFVKLISSSAVVNGGGNQCQFTSKIITSVLRLGLQQQLLKLARETNGTKMKKSLEIMEKSLPDDVKFSQPTGGYFIWVQLPGRIVGKDLKAMANTVYGINVGLGTRFLVSGDGEDKVRLCVASLVHDDLIRQMTMFCECVCQYSVTSPGTAVESDKQ